MVRNSSWIKLFLVLVMVTLSAISMASAQPILSPKKEINDEEELTVRIERSRLTGTGSKIRMYIREKYLQLFTDGTVNATDDEKSIYNILQRSSVSPGRVKIQSVATCTFLCMDLCGLLYSTKEFHDECVFGESLEMDYYNVYSSEKYSNSERTLYLGITRNGTPRKVEIKGHGSLGKLSPSAAVLPQPVDHQTVQDLENQLLAPLLKANRHLRHHQLCPPSHHSALTSSKKCLMQQKNKKRKKTFDERTGDEGKTKKHEENDDTPAPNKRNKKRRKKPKPDEETVNVSAEADAEDEDN